MRISIVECAHFLYLKIDRAAIKSLISFVKENNRISL